MDFRTILVDLGDDAAREARIEAAGVLAARTQGCVLGITATGGLLEPPHRGGAEAANDADWPEGPRRRLADRDAELLHRVLARVAPSVSASHIITDGEAGWALAVHGRAADLLLPAPPGRNESVSAPMAQAAEYALLHAGRPMLMMRPNMHLRLDGHVIVAWDGRREASRVLADALPLLALAGQVTICVFTSENEIGADDKGAGDLVPWLARHGVHATIRIEEAASVEDALLRVIGHEKPALLVAGGYGHSRLGELILGGTTRTLLRGSTVPLFMSH